MLEAAAAAGLVYTTVSPAEYLPQPVPAEFAPHLGLMTVYRFTWRQ
jgi:hypothetical protein